jgi:hypothetical protein
VQHTDQLHFTSWVTDCYFQGLFSSTMEKVNPGAILQRSTAISLKQFSASPCCHDCKRSSPSRSFEAISGGTIYCIIFIRNVFCLWHAHRILVFKSCTWISALKNNVYTIMLILRRSSYFNTILLFIFSANEKEINNSKKFIVTASIVVYLLFDHQLIQASEESRWKWSRIFALTVKTNSIALTFCFCDILKTYYRIISNKFILYFHDNDFPCVVINSVITLKVDQPWNEVKIDYCFI